MLVQMYNPNSIQSKHVEAMKLRLVFLIRYAQHGYQHLPILSTSTYVTSPAQLDDDLPNVKTQAYERHIEVQDFRSQQLLRQNFGSQYGLGL
jgi:hypothetical protein